MSLRERIAGTLLGKDYVADLKESIVKELKESGISSGREEDEGFRSLTEDVKRDLTPLTQERMQEICFHLYENNPFAHRILEMSKDFVVGEGAKIVAQNEGVQKVLDEFWEDPVNNWDLKQGQRILELGLWGEQFYPVAVNEINGKVRMGYLDPGLVSRVLPDKDNSEIIRMVKKRGSITSVQQNYKVINPDENVRSETYGYLTGEIFYFAINKVAGGVRGRSDLFCLADWIDGYDQFLFNTLERSHLMNVFLWDIELEGYNQKQIDDWLKDQTLPKPASMRAHNEKVTWSAVVPELGAHDTSEQAKLFKNFVLGGAGYPPHWFAGGEGLTRATALEMSTPVIKMLTSKQRHFKYMIRYILTYVIHQAIIHKELPKDVDRRFTVAMPKLLEKDIYTLSLGLKFIIEALEKGQEKGWVEKKDSRRIFAYMLSQLGLEVEAMVEEKKEKDKGEGEEE